MVTMKFIVRKAEEKDLSAVEKLYEEKRDYPYSPFGREKRDAFRKMLSDEQWCVFVGERNGNISAYLSMRIERRFENFMKASAVISDIKVSGNDAEILCAILSRSIAVAMENECCEICLYDKKVKAETNSVYSICGFRESNTFFTKRI